ncbi:MAG: polymer-forming cytoskeletal protein [Chloroflexota bacterium]
MKHKLLILPLTLILYLVLAVPAFAQEPDRGSQVVFGRDFTLAEGETISGDVAVFGGKVELAEGSQIDGSLAAIGGNVKIDGTVNGDVAALGGDITLGDSATVNGDIALLGGKADIAEGAKLTGDVVNLTEGKFDGHFGDGFTVPVPPAPEAPPIPQPPQSEFSGFAFGALSFLKDLAWNIAVIIGLAALSWLVATFMPEQMKLVGDTVAESAPLSFGIGLLTMAVSIVVGIPLLITICLAFIPLLAYILIGIAMLFGWIAIGQLLGDRLMAAIGQTYPNFALSTVVGVVVLTIVTKMPVVSWIPCLGFILGFLGGLAGIILSLTGLGAVLLTRFGSRPYPPRSASASAYSVPRGPAPVDTDFSDLDINSASEAELKAKIKAALAEADKLKQELKPEPAPTEPAEPEPPTDHEPDDPGKNPKIHA